MAVTYTPKCVEGFNTSNLYNKIHLFFEVKIIELTESHKTLVRLV